MRRGMAWFAVFVVWLVPLAHAADEAAAPYFVVSGGTSGADPLPLKSTRVEAEVEGVIAEVLVRQTYRNEGQRPLEAVYVFPASTRAAVHGVRMTVGGRTILARIEERRAARDQYETAKNRGQSAALLEQQRPNVFQMNVANILPGDTVEVELRYSEALVPDAGEYAFVLPTVVGPRYAEAGAKEPWRASPYQHQGEPARSRLELDLHLRAGLPIGEIACSTHKVRIERAGAGEARVVLDDAEAYAGNRDFVLRYRLSGDRVQTGLILQQGRDENFFLLMVQPPRRTAPRDLPPREYVFVMDVSGSMSGFPLEVSKTLVRDLVGNLRAGDRFDVLLFAGSSSLLSETPLPATRENVERALAFVDAQRGGGGTELVPALRRALALPRTAGFARTVVIATDGFVGVEPEAFALVRSSLGEANLFPFGIGTSVNRHLIEGLARAGQGEPFVVDSAGNAPGSAQAFRRYVESPVLADVTFEARGLEVYDVDPPVLPDVFAERPVVVCGKWRGRPSGQLVVRGRGAQPFEKVLDVSAAPLDREHAALAHLWARRRVASLADDLALEADPKVTEEVTKLGLRYELLTAYTSFVAIDSRIRNTGEAPETVKQPLPLPEGVSDAAVGGIAPQAFAYGGVAGGVQAAALAPPPPPTEAITFRSAKLESRAKSVAEDRVSNEPASPAACLVTELRTWTFAAGPRRTVVALVEFAPGKDPVVTVTQPEQNADARTLQKLLKQHAAAITACRAQSVTLRIRLVIESDGHVSEVTMA